MPKQYIDMTPTWSAILPHWLMLYREAARGTTNDNEGIMEKAEAEFHRMAQAADNWNEYIRDADIQAGIHEMEAVNEALSPESGQ